MHPSKAVICFTYSHHLAGNRSPLYDKVVACLAVVGLLVLVDVTVLVVHSNDTHNIHQPRSVERVRYIGEHFIEASESFVLFLMSKVVLAAGTRNSGLRRPAWGLMVARHSTCRSLPWALSAYAAFSAVVCLAQKITTS